MQNIEDEYFAMDGKFKSSLPTFVGFWMMNGIRVSATSKPNMLHRVMAKLLLGWRWENAE